MKSRTVYIGLGSNIGKREDNIESALRLLQDDPRVTLAGVSSLYETSPVGPRQRDFLNAAAKIRTSLGPRALLRALKGIEARLGRRPGGGRWGPRAIDLDILFYGSKVLKGKTLELPHPRLAERLFVLIPLAEIAPGFRHPVLKKTVRKLRDNLLLTSGKQKVTMYSVHAKPASCRGRDKDRDRTWKKTR
ncbi:MAG: 2-amino-4-hydroxy-6-hydroxymethyldihydropteridine diphosphokinase [Endomicrobiales bacterium]